MPKASFDHVISRVVLQHTYVIKQECSGLWEYWGILNPFTCLITMINELTTLINTRQNSIKECDIGEELGTLKTKAMQEVWCTSVHDPWPILKLLPVLTLSTEFRNS